MCLNDFKGKGQSALAQCHVGHVVSLWSTVISFSFSLFICQKKKNTYTYRHSIYYKNATLKIKKT